MANNQHLTRRSALALGGGALAALPFGSAFGQKRGGTLVLAMPSQPPSLTSYLFSSGTIAQCVSNVYNGLLEYDLKVRPRPSLARSWTVSDDGRTVTFNLQTGVKFHDGQPMTSADVQYSIMEVLKPHHPRASQCLNAVETVDTPDPHTVVFRLAHPAPYMMAGLHGWDCPILPKHNFLGKDVRNHPAASHPIGTGPYRFVEWSRGQYIRYERNPDYWRAAPFFDRVVMRFISEGATMAAAVERGEVHLVANNGVPLSEAKRLGGLTNIGTTTEGAEWTASTLQVQFNVRRKPFDNVKVRQAIAHAIDREFIKDQIFFGFGKVATGPFASTSTFYSADVKRYQDPQGVKIANDILDQSGFPRDANGVRFEMTLDVLPGYFEVQRTGEYIIQVLRSIGIKANLRREEAAVYQGRVFRNYDFDAVLLYSPTTGDPVIGPHLYYHSKGIRPGVPYVNCMGWHTPETDKIMDDATVENNPERRRELYTNLQKRLLEEVPSTWLMEMAQVTVYDKSLRDIYNSALGPYASTEQVRRD